MTELQHHFVTTNGVKMHYVEQGSGPLVVMCHGWPESWYSWRHQIPALAQAGFRDASKIVEVSMPGCRKQAIIPGAGHWIQQERPAEINQLLVEFVKSL